MSETIYRVRPTATDAYLANPHKGCCTFQHFNGDEFFPGIFWGEEGPLEFSKKQSLSNHVMTRKTNSGGRWIEARNGYLPSAVAYCRWFWDVLEPKAGKYDFSMIDSSLARCRETGQTLAVRLMAHGDLNQPKVPVWYDKRYTMLDTIRAGRPFRTPDYDSDDYFKIWGELIKAFAEKYDGNPLLESIDVAFIGPWGEGDGACSREQCIKFAELFAAVFKHTPRLALVAGEQFAEGINRGSGWRADCFGDTIGSEDNNGTTTLPRHLAWNHMFDCYPATVCRANAQDVWKQVPVHLETCWVPEYWYQMGRDIEWIIQQGWKYHATYFMPKYTQIPDALLPDLRRFCSRLGYRFAFRQAILIQPPQSQNRFSLQIWIENVGVAPLYRDYGFAIRLRQDDKEVIIPQANVNVCSWMPGDTWLDLEIAIPEGFKLGAIEVAAGIVDNLGVAKINFAVEERFNDRWLPITSIVI